MLSLMPNILALMTVQRQIAASRSARPWMRVQQGVTGGAPTVTLSKPPSKSTHTPSLRASLGHEAAWEGVLGLGLFGFGLFGFGFGLFGFRPLGLGLAGLVLGPGHVPLPHAVTSAKKRRLREKKRAREAELLEAISQTLIVAIRTIDIYQKSYRSSTWEDI